mgnify:CR=1 FL=1
MKQDQILKLTRLFNCSTSERFEILHNANLPSNLIYRINLEGPPSITSVTVERILVSYGDKNIEEKFWNHIESQPLPKFIQDYIDRGNV